MQQQRRRIKQEKTFEERLAEEAQRFKEAASTLAETASHINQWLSSKALQPPTEGARQ